MTKLLVAIFICAELVVIGLCVYYSKVTGYMPTKFELLLLSFNPITLTLLTMFGYKQVKNILND
jgi:hypothetical protein